MSSLEEDLNTFRIYRSGLSMAEATEETGDELSPQDTGVGQASLSEEEEETEEIITPIDLPALAERIYRLLKQELRLERERLA